MNPVETQEPSLAECPSPAEGNHALKHRVVWVVVGFLLCAAGSLYLVGLIVEAGGV